MAVYDAVIVGSGLGGLATALILAKEGMRVIVLEKNRQPGGALQIFSRDKAIIDTGVHYLGSLGKGEVLERYFSYFNIYDKLKLEKLDDSGFDRVLLPSGEYPYAQGFHQYAETLSTYFPKEKDGLKKYVHALEEVIGHFPVYRVEPGLVNPVENKWMQVTAKDWIAGFVNDPILRQVLAGTHMLYEGNPESTPAYVHAMTVASYIKSAWRMVDGGGQLAKYLVDEIKKHGGEFRNYTEVAGLRGKNGEITTAITRQGEEFEGKKFIFNIHPFLMLDMFPEGMVRKGYASRIKTLPNSLGTFTAHCIMKPGQFAYRRHNVYGFTQPDVWNASQYTTNDWPRSFAAFFSRRADSSFTECANLMTLMRFEEVEPWSKSFRTYPHFSDSRGEDYEEWKAQKIEKILNLANECMPGFKDSVQSVYASTPLSYRDYIGSPEGSMYGIRKDARSPYASVFSPRTKISNVFMTGQNLNLHGIVGVTISSVITAGEILGNEYLLNKIRSSG
ncbi:MAG: NAD(P)/FAD-dependent oxidoreductase [Flavobacteriales bacterium]|nr:NAD(P)/FAD-dependent oxidoreductase [Flavobacteriales bacterium]